MKAVNRTQDIPARFMPMRRKRGKQAKWYYVPSGALAWARMANKVHKVEIYKNGRDAGFRVRMTANVQDSTLSFYKVCEMQTGG